MALFFGAPQILLIYMIKSAPLFINIFKKNISYLTVPGANGIPNWEMLRGWRMSLMNYIMTKILYLHFLVKSTNNVFLSIAIYPNWSNFARQGSGI